MRKTTITPNRFITYTRSWWAKSTYLLSFLVILFSCEEDLNFLGFNNQQRFKVFYAEIPVASSTLWMDSLSTLSFITDPATESNRLLFGSYQDPVFGTITAKAFSQFKPVTFPTLASTALFDSAILTLRYDFYSYGSSGKTPQTVSVHEITQVMKLTDRYFFNTEIEYNSNPISTSELQVDADYFKVELTDTTPDSLLLAKFTLDNEFGQRLFDAIDRNDTLYTNPTFFTQQFKGLAIVPHQSDKIVRINNFDQNTRLTLYYHEEAVVKSVIFSVEGPIAFTQINSDRSGTELAGLNTTYTQYTSTNNRYIQNGGSLVTQLDFSKFYEYIDTIPAIIINSAELSINNVASVDQYAAPSNLTLALMRSDNRYKTIAADNNTLDPLGFSGLLSIRNFDNLTNLSDGGGLFAANDGFGLFTASYSTTNQSYLGYPTLFFQKLFDLKQTEYPYWALFPASPFAGKSVHRAVFPKDSIKLKIYYTRPILEENP